MSDPAAVHGGGNRAQWHDLPPRVQSRIGAMAGGETVLAATAGFFACASVLPAPPGLPTLRAFQRSQAVIALDWLRTRLGERS